jgi:transposase
MWLDGVSLKETSAQCELSRATAIAASEAFHEGGWKAVMVDRPGRPAGTGRALTAEQEREVQRPIRDRTPDQLKMVYALWTRQAVAAATVARRTTRRQAGQRTRLRGDVSSLASKASAAPVPKASSIDCSGCSRT